MIKSLQLNWDNERHELQNLTSVKKRMENLSDLSDNFY